MPLFFVVWALSNFAGPLILGRLFDTVGRKAMISMAYLGSAAVAVGLAALFVSQTGGVGVFIAVLSVCFFLASSGASAAYLTVSEIFPMETRALAIAFFYAVGTAIGGITGPLLFGQLIETGDRGPVAFAFLIGAAAMAIGGVVELMFGVKAEGQNLEALAAPLTTADKDTSGEDDERRARDRRASRRGGNANALGRPAGDAIGPVRPPGGTRRGERRPASVRRRRRSITRSKRFRGRWPTTKS